MKLSSERFSDGTQTVCNQHMIGEAMNKYRSDGLVPLLRAAPGYGLHRARRRLKPLARHLPERYYRMVMGEQLKSRDELHNFWKNASNRNAPEAYLDKEPRSKFLHQVLSEYAGPDNSVLEVGCNAGRNLNELHRNGYRDLAGVEINPDAIGLLRQEYPHLAEDARLFTGPAEDILPENFDDDEFDICFSMAVLMHLHPESEFVFEEMVRVTGKYLIVCEDESVAKDRHVPRDYGQLFTGLGMELVETIEAEAFPPEVDLADGYVLRVFEPNQ